MKRPTAPHFPARRSARTLHTDGLQVTATTTNGVAEIVDFDDKAKSGAGGTVHVRF